MALALLTGAAILPAAAAADDIPPWKLTLGEYAYADPVHW
jgi:hypothetical protein